MSRPVPETPAVESDDDIVVPQDRLHEESARTTTALKKVHLVSGKWPWELIDEQYVPAQWSQNLAEKLVNIMTLHSTVDSFITFDEITAFLHETIEGPHRRGAKKVLTVSDCDLLRIWLVKKKHDHGGSPSISPRKRDAGEADLSPDRGTRSRSRALRTASHDSPLPLTLARTSNKNSGTMDSAISPRSRVVGDRHATPGTPSVPTVTLDKAFCSWLSDCQTHAATDLQNAKETQAANNQQLDEQIKLKEEISAAKPGLDKECSDAQVNYDSLMDKYKQAQDLIKGLQPVVDNERAQGRECPVELAAILDKYRSDLAALEPSLDAAEEYLKTKQDQITKLDNEFKACDAAIEKLTSDVQTHHDQVIEKQNHEKGNAHLLALARLGSHGIANSGQELIGQLGQVISLMQEHNNAGM
ncbi:hypothetical protein ACHAPU_010817 [Fusarium lateritium]